MKTVSATVLQTPGSLRRPWTSDALVMGRDRSLIRSPYLIEVGVERLTSLSRTGCIAARTLGPSALHPDSKRAREVSRRLDTDSVTTAAGAFDIPFASLGDRSGPRPSRNLDSQWRSHGRYLGRTHPSRCRPRDGPCVGAVRNLSKLRGVEAVPPRTLVAVRISTG